MQSFNEILRGAPGLSKSLLVERLRRLQRAGIVDAVPNPHGRGSMYYFTDAGKDLAEVCKVLGRWGARWMEMELEHMDPVTVLWAKTRAWDVSKLPQDRIVIRFDVTDHAKALWILVQRNGAELCARYPGFPEDLVVTADREALALWHTGALSYREAIRSGRVRVEGPRALVRTFPDWCPLSAFADVKPVRATVHQG